MSFADFHTLGTLDTYEHLVTKMSNQVVWCDRFLYDISSQLALFDIDKSNFDGPFLRKDTTNGAWLWSLLVLLEPPLTNPYPLSTLTVLGAHL